MKRILFLFPLGLAFLAGCDSTSPDNGSSASTSNTSTTTGGNTSSSGTSSSGTTSGDATHDASLVGTWWLKQFVSGSWADTVKYSYNADGTDSWYEHYVEWSDGRISFYFNCTTPSGTWSTWGKDSLQSSGTAKCVVNDTTSERTKTSKRRYWISGRSLFLCCGEKSSGEPDTVVFTKE